MPAIKYRVTLTEKEKAELEGFIHKGKSSARSQTRARIMLKAAEGKKDGKIMEALSVSIDMVEHTRKRCVEEGVMTALYDRPRPGAEPKLTDKQSAYIIALACTTAPTGHDHWTLRLLSDKVVELGFASTCSYELIRRLLKKTL